MINGPSKKYNPPQTPYNGEEPDSGGQPKIYFMFSDTKKERRPEIRPPLLTIQNLN
jgi:hypothetical protein